MRSIKAKLNRSRKQQRRIEPAAMDTGPVRIEIVCQSVQDARAAQEGGAHRIELCMALAGAGGLTPTSTLLQAVKDAVKLPVMAMVRPRPGGFFYSIDEANVLLHEAETLTQHGADGLVFGMLNPDATINTELCRKIANVAQSLGREPVFHRAFDVTPDPFEALEILIEIGITRVLTSGQAKTALEGAGLISELRKRADGRIEILPGGGVRAHNAREILARTGCDQLHLAPLVSVMDPTASRGAVSYGAHDRVETEAVAAVVRAVNEDSLKN